MNAYVPVLLEAFDRLHHATTYLSMAWGIDTPREYMQANVDARLILTRLEHQVLDEAETFMNEVPE